MKSKLFYFGLSGITNSGKTTILNYINYNKNSIIKKLHRDVFKCNKDLNEIEKLINISFENKKFVSDVLSLQLNEKEKQVIMNKYYREFDQQSMSKLINISDQSFGATIAYNYINSNFINMTNKEIENTFLDFKKDMDNYVNFFKDILNKYDVYINILRIYRDKEYTLKYTTYEEEIYFGDINILKSLDANLDMLSKIICENKDFKKVVIKEYNSSLNQIELLADQIISYTIDFLIKHAN